MVEKSIAASHTRRRKGIDRRKEKKKKKRTGDQPLKPDLKRGSCACVWGEEKREKKVAGCLSKGGGRATLGLQKGTTI